MKIGYIIEVYYKDGSSRRIEGYAQRLDVWESRTTLTFTLDGVMEEIVLLDKSSNVARVTVETRSASGSRNLLRTFEGGR